MNDKAKKVVSISNRANDHCGKAVAGEVESPGSSPVVIVATHRKTGERRFFGSITTGITKPTDEEIQLYAGIDVEVIDNEVTAFSSLEEASCFPFPSSEAAAMVLLTFPKTKNLDFELLEVEGRSD